MCVIYPIKTEMARYLVLTIWKHEQHNSQSFRAEYDLALSFGCSCSLLPCLFQLQSSSLGN